MSKTVDFDILVGAAGWIVGLIGIGYAIGTHSKVNKLCDKLDCSVEDLVDNTDIHIPEETINRVVERAVAKRADYAVDRAIRAAVVKVQDEITNQVASAVNKECDRLEDSVKKEIKSQIRLIDISDLRREVKEEAAEKLEESMDDILEKFNGDLENVSKIYSSIANAITKNSETGTIVRIS